MFEAHNQRRGKQGINKETRERQFMEEVDEYEVRAAVFSLELNMMDNLSDPLHQKIRGSQSRRNFA